MKPNRYGWRYLGAFQAFFLAVVLVAGVGPINQWIHILQVHHTDFKDHGGCGRLCHHDGGHAPGPEGCGLETQKPDGHAHHIRANAGRQGHDDHDRSSGHENCPECQVLNSLKTIDPPSVPVDHLFTRERCAAISVPADFVFEDPFHLLPSIRAPPAI